MNVKKKWFYYISTIVVFFISTGLQIKAIYNLEHKQYRESEISFIASYLIVCLLILFLYVTNYMVIRFGEKTEKQKITFGRLALSLVSDYESVYYIDAKNESYIEYGNVKGEDGLVILSHGDNFYSDTLINAAKLVYEEDREHFLEVISRDTLNRAYKNKETIILKYRLLVKDHYEYYNLKVTHGSGEDDKYIIIGVKNVDAQIKAEELKDRAVEKGITFGHIAHALASNYEVIYYVDTDTNEYFEYASSEAYSQLKVGNRGEDFFEATQINMRNDIYSEDYPMMKQTMDKDYFMKMLEMNKYFTIRYRLLLNGKPEFVELRATRPKDDDVHIVVGVMNINDMVKKQLEIEQKLDDVLVIATRDALTGVKNKNAYDEYEKKLDEMIESKKKLGFAVVVCDVNNLKTVNDTHGHKAGDEYIREACRIICKIFKHSPVYRIGGDEFVVIMRGEDYDNRRALFGQLRDQMDINSEDNKVVFASGISEYDPSKDSKLVNVFERADRDMYQNKKMLKSL